MKTNHTPSVGAGQVFNVSFLGFPASEEPQAAEEAVGEISAGGEGDADAREALAFDVVESAALAAELREERARTGLLGQVAVPASVELADGVTVRDLADRHTLAELQQMADALSAEIDALGVADLEAHRAQVDALLKRPEGGVRRPDMIECLRPTTSAPLGEKAVQGIAGACAVALIERGDVPATIEAPRKALSAVGLSVALPDRFHETQNGHRPASAANLALACQRPDIIGCTIGFDTFRDELMLSNDGGRTWAPFKDEHSVLLKLRMEHEHRFQKVATDALREHVYAAGKHNSFDSARLWLEGLPPWDGVPRIDAFCPRYLGAEDREYTRAVGAYMWTALAGRVMSPGIKADMVPVWVGRQGARKSSSIAAISPSPDFFDELAFDVRDADLSRKLKGLLVGELAELRGLATRELEAIKNFITQRFETWTPKFKEMPVTFARRCVFIGSTNEEQFLADKTGERRWLPVTVGECRPDLIERDRLQLWAEGLARFRANGIEWQAAERLAEGEHEQYKAPDLWEEQIAGWLMCEGPDGARNDARPFTLGEVMAQALHLEAKNVKRADENRVGKILRGLGFAQQQARIDGVKARRWVKT